MVQTKELLICFVLLAGCGSCDDERSDNPNDPDGSSRDDGLSDVATPDSGMDAGFDDLGNPNPTLFIPDIDELDDTFGNGGLSTVTSTPNGLSTIWDLDVQTDGKIVGFGRTFESGYLFRLTSDGRRDPSFGNAGIAYLPFGKRTFSFAFKIGNIEIGPDNSIFVSHWFSPFSQLIGSGYVLKLNSSGEIDPGFAEDGLYRSGFREFSHGVQLENGGGRYLSGPSVSITGLDAAGVPDGFELALPDLTQIYEIKQLQDGSWLGAGNGTNQTAVIVKLTSDWEVDTSFGEQGRIVIEQMGNGQTGFWDFDIDSRDRIVAVGSKEIVENQNSFAVARFTPTGALDATFGDAGWVLGSGTGIGFGVRVVDGDRILAVGNATFDEEPTAVVQLEEDGSRGWTTPIASVQSALTVEFAGDGNLLVGGSNQISKIGVDGALDSSFGDSGTVSLPLNHSFEFGSVAYEEDDGSLLVSGTVDGISSTVARVRPDGTVDPNFGLALTPRIRSDVKSITKSSDGSYLLGGRAVNETAFFFSKLLADNTVEKVTLQIPDTPVAWPFDTEFVSTDEIYTVGVYSDNNSLRMGIIKADENGVIDTAFGAAGRASGEIEGNSAGAFDDAQVFKDPDGKITARYNNRIYRFNPDGTPDDTLSAPGFVTGYQWLHPLTDGTYLARVDDTESVQVVRLLNDFTVDTTFNGGTPITLDTNPYFEIGITIKDDGSFYVFSATGGPLTTNGYVASVNANGSLDTTFGTNGELKMKMSEYSSSLKSGFVNRAGKLVAIGHAWTFEGGSDIAVVRFD